MARKSLAALNRYVAPTGLLNGSADMKSNQLTVFRQAVKQKLWKYGGH